MFFSRPGEETRTNNALVGATGAERALVEANKSNAKTYLEDEEGDARGRKGMPCFATCYSGEVVKSRLVSLILCLSLELLLVRRRFAADLGSGCARPTVSRTKRVCVIL